MRFNPDQLNNVDAVQAANASMQLLDGIQNLPPHLQIFAVTAAFQLLTERFDIHAQSAFAVAHNVMRHADGRRTEFKAIEMYLENEL